MFKFRAILFICLLSIIIHLPAQNAVPDNNIELRKSVQHQMLLTIDHSSNKSQPKLKVQLPVTLTMIATGAVSHYWQPMSSINVTIRDGVQQWRNSAFNGRRYTFDNYTQYLPYAALLALKLADGESKHNPIELTTCAAGSILIMVILVNGTKKTLQIQRPDQSAYNSFPSGHTATVFCGTEMLRLEYGDKYPWIVATSFAVATLTGIMRIYNNRHWAGDVLAGAGVGILSADLSFWLNDKIRAKRKNKKTPIIDSKTYSL